MGFTVSLYTFSKKANSTARPTTAAVSYSCVIKEPCGILQPNIGLDLGLSAAPYNYNYAFIPAFDRYYHVREWTFQNALWYAALEVDALASWKQSIGASTCYVMRSSFQKSPAIVDTMYPATKNTTMEETIITSPWTLDIDSGTFVVGVAGQATTYYLFTKGMLDLFFTWLFSDVYAAELTDDWSTVFPQLKAQSNPLQYITSIMWLPFTVIGTSVSSVRVGWADVGTSCWKVDGSGLYAAQTVFTVHRHPEAATRGTYLNNAPFSSYTLFFPPWGTIPLDPDIMANSTTIDVYYAVDLQTGMGTLSAFGGDQHLMSWTHAQVGQHYQVSQVVNRGYGAAELLVPVLSVGANIVTGNFAGIAATASAEIGNAAAAKIPSATTIGSAGGRNALNGAPALQYQFKEIVNDNGDDRGYPLCANYQISEIPGYIMVADVDISIPATQREKEIIGQFMKGGFYYE